MDVRPVNTEKTAGYSEACLVQNYDKDKFRYAFDSTPSICLEIGVK